jgi:pimeloyl-ACP methyl ester carboxylesterase
MARIGNLIRATPPTGYIGSGQAIARLDVTEKLPALRNPTLVIAGGDDAGTPPAMGQRIAENIPNARFEPIASASHLCNIEQATIFNRLLLGFFGSVDSR